ncbi:MAG TPA: DegV family protein [Clostridia bacterium]|nr:DegV family protein [Clostridia bacterium]
MIVLQRVKVVTDSTSDLTQELLAQYDIRMVPLYVRFGEEVYADGVEINNRQLFQKVAQTGIMPQTAAPTPEDFLSVFKEIIEAGSDVICICLSSHLSATVQSAMIAAGELPPGRVEVIDGLNLSSATGMLAIYAAELAQQGLPLSEIVPLVKARVPKLSTQFVVDTMEYLYKGGRCSGLQSLMAGVLKIHPMLTMSEGKIVVKEKIRGGGKKIVDRLVECIVTDKDKVDRQFIAVTGAACPEMVEAIVQRVQQEFPGARVFVTEAGSVISSHCGPGTVGILYMLQ